MILLRSLQRCVNHRLERGKINRDQVSQAGGDLGRSGVRDQREIVGFRDFRGQRRHTLLRGHVDGDQRDGSPFAFRRVACGI